jgi:hypothetical protein
MATKGETDDIYCDLCQVTFSMTGGNTSFTTNNVMRRTMKLGNIAMIITVLLDLLNKDG